MLTSTQALGVADADGEQNLKELVFSLHRRTPPPPRPITTAKDDPFAQDPLGTLENLSDYRTSIIAEAEL